MDSLSPERREQLAMFQSVTHESSAPAAVSLLSSCGWNVENAIATHFAIVGAAGNTANANAQSNQTMTSVSPNSSVMTSPYASPAPGLTRAGSTSNSSLISRPSPPPTDAAAAARAAAASPASSTSSSVSASASSSPPASSSGRGGGWLGSGLIGRVSGALTRSIWGANSAAAPDAPKTPQEAFLSELAKTYGPYVPDFFNGSYTDAVKEARTRGRLLFVYLHSSAHDDTDGFLRNTLCIEQTYNFLRENFVSWAGTIKHTDSYRLAHTFDASSFPFVAVLAPQAAANSVAVVFRRCGVLDSDSLVRELLHRMELHSQISATLNQARAAEEEQRNQASQARSLREQQDQEYEESLLMDQGIKEAQEREAREMEEMLRISRETEEAAQRERARLAAEEEERKANAEAERLARLAALPDEPPVTAEGVVNISFRLPNSKKVSRRFLDSSTIGTVQQFLSSLEDIQPLGEKYRILSNFPRKVHEDPTATLASLKLGKQIQLIIESTADEEEEDMQQ